MYSYVQIVDMPSDKIQCAICLDTEIDEFLPHACLRHCFHRCCLEKASAEKCPICRQDKPLHLPSPVHWTQNSPIQDAQVQILQAANRLQADLTSFNNMDGNLTNALIAVCSAFYKAHINSTFAKLQNKLNHL
jgi:hypothetical protein